MCEGVMMGTGGRCLPLFASFVKLPASEFKEVVPARGDLLQGQCVSNQKLVLLGHRLLCSIDLNDRVRRWFKSDRNWFEMVAQEVIGIIQSPRGDCPSTRVTRCKGA